MIILLSNDDGYNANGIKVLSKSLDQIAHVILCAPMKNHSGSSSSLSLRKDISVKQIEKDVFVFSGTPADTVHLGLSGFLDVTPDLVVSGINHGANLGEDILYSGTVAAAIEGRVLDMPSIAVSSLGDTERDFKVAARVTIELIQRLKKYSLPKDTILNVNVPAINYDEINGFCITRLGNRHRSHPIKKVSKDKSEKVFQIGLPGKGRDAGPGTDFYAIQHNSVSISPLHIDMTHHAIFNNTERWLSKK